MKDLRLKTAKTIASYFDKRKKGHVGNSGYRKTSDLGILFDVVNELVSRRIVVPDSTIFLDLGCGDGRVCMLMSYFCRWAIGIEVEEFIYDEYLYSKKQIEHFLRQNNLLPLPSGLCVLLGDSLSESIHRTIEEKTGITIRDVDIFYTYITLHDVYAEMLRDKAKIGSYYMVYGFSGIIPSYDGFSLLDPDVSGKKTVALYCKK